MPIIDVKNVSKQFGKGTAAAHVLDNLSFSVEKGEFVSLMGASGSGKSTMLYLIGGLDRDFDGTIELCGEDISVMKEKQLSKLRLEKIGFIFQFYNLVQNLSVADNIMLPLNVRGKKRGELKDRLDEILELTGLSDKRKAMPSQLSGGQQQRVAIAKKRNSHQKSETGNDRSKTLNRFVNCAYSCLLKKIFLVTYIYEQSEYM